jgi:hypothetical protein
VIIMVRRARLNSSVRLLRYRGSMSSIRWLFAVVFLMICGNAAHACECIRTPTVGEAFEEADAVFSGKVISVRDYRARIQIERVWKGTLPAEVTSFTSDRIIDRRGKRPQVVILTSSCGMVFREGESYLVYATGKNLKPTECSRTSYLGLAQEDLKELGAGYAPLTVFRNRGNKLLRRRSRTTHCSRPSPASLSSSSCVASACFSLSRWLRAAEFGR